MVWWFERFSAHRRRNKVLSRVSRGYVPGENTLLRGNGATIPKESSPVSPASLSKKSLDFFEKAQRFFLVTLRLFATAWTLQVSPSFAARRRRNKMQGLCFPRTCASENTLLMGNGATIPKESSRISHASPHKSPWTFVRRLSASWLPATCFASASPGSSAPLRRGRG